MLYILVGIFMFGLLIAVHEFGHFITAKAFHIRVNEFAIGMGPALLQKKKGETLYSLRAFPVGGYCAMEGEDEDSDDPRAFANAKGYQKFVVLVAGAFMNFLTGVVLVLLLFLPSDGFLREVYGGGIEGYGVEDCGLQEGDIILSVDGHQVLVYGNARFYLNRAGDTVDFVVERNGEKVTLDNVYLPYQEKVDEEGNRTYLRGIYVNAIGEQAGFFGKVTYAWNMALDFVRMVWLSMGDLVRGAVGLRDLSGPVGIVDTMAQVGEQSATAVDAVYNLTTLAALIAVNLAVMNLLPLPALDGGRVLFLLLNGVLYTLFKRKIPAQYEGYVLMAGLAVLLGLSVPVTFSDILKIIQ